MNNEETRFVKVTDGNDKEYGTYPLNANPDLLKKVVDKNKQKEEVRNKMVGNKTSEAAERIDQEVERIKQQQKQVSEETKKSVAEGLAAAKERIGPMVKGVVKAANKEFAVYEKAEKIKKVIDINVPEDYPKMSDEEKDQYIYDSAKALESILTDLPQDQVSIIMNRINLERLHAKEMANSPQPGDEDLLPIEKLGRKITKEDRKIITEFEKDVESATFSEVKKRIPILIITYMIDSGLIDPTDAIEHYTNIETFITMQSANLNDWAFSV